MVKRIWQIRLVLVVTLMSIIGVWETASAQMGFPDEGIMAARGRQPLHTSNSSAVLINGGFVNTWTEGDMEGIIRVYAQVVSPDGHLIFPQNPVVLSTGENHASGSKVVATSDGGSIICWKEYIGDGDSENVRAQRLNERGEAEWEDGGRLIHDFP